MALPVNIRITYSTGEEDNMMVLYVQMMLVIARFLGLVAGGCLVAGLLVAIFTHYSLQESVTQLVAYLQTAYNTL